MQVNFNNSFKEESFCVTKTLLFFPVHGLNYHFIIIIYAVATNVITLNGVKVGQQQPVETAAAHTSD